jgi:hypothetical protein|tara:strand:- start:166 stop:744 length:579 start_codon:yes stop_codon:yes gene_type:complete
MKSGVYFIWDGQKVRIGEGKDAKKRIKQHISSRGTHNTKILGLLLCEENETKYEENLAEIYFKSYHIEASFYSPEVKDLVTDYINNRILEKLDIKELEIKRKGEIQTLWGPETITNFLPKCDMFPWKYATYMGRKDSAKGLKPRKIKILGKYYYFSEPAKKWYQNIVKDKKQKIRKKLLKNGVKEHLLDGIL